MEKYCTEKSRQLHEETKKYLVDGVASSFQVPHYAKYPITMTHGKGSKLYDVDGNEYIDYLLGFGPMLLGYCPEAVNKAVIEQISKGTHYSCPTKETLTLSKKLTEIIPSAEMISFQNSGTEVDMYALRLARAYTGKYKIVKFEGQYHGWADEEKISIDADCVEEMGDRANPNKIIHTKGQRLSSADDLYVIPWNDLEYMENLFKEHADEIAAVIMEPIMLDSGPIMPAKGYLEGVRELTKKYNVLLIFDEVITGFRVALGGAQEYFGVTPDISTFAKAIASGYPFGVVAGRKDVMTSLKAAGTFNGNPVGTAAALATIAELEKPGTYERLNKLTGMLDDGFQKLGKKHGIKVFTRHMGSVFALYFGFEEEVADLREWLEKADVAFYQKFVQGLEEYGIRFSSKRGRIYISTAHTEEDILHTLDVADQVIGEILAK
ncbi:MAG: aspartate aminotransferase family protein [Oscillospiraceae bacterium]|nr:aspartate aminotransferase family protein [Oscillospiraceae bacterium]